MSEKEKSAFDGIPKIGMIRDTESLRKLRKEIEELEGKLPPGMRVSIQCFEGTEPKFDIFNENVYLSEIKFPEKRNNPESLKITSSLAEILRDLFYPPKILPNQKKPISPDSIKELQEELQEEFDFAKHGGAYGYSYKTPGGEVTMILPGKDPTAINDPKDWKPSLSTMKKLYLLTHQMAHEQNSKIVLLHLGDASQRMGLKDKSGEVHKKIRNAAVALAHPFVYKKKKNRGSAGEVVSLYRRVKWEGQLVAVLLEDAYLQGIDFETGIIEAPYKKISWDQIFDNSPISYEKNIRESFIRYLGQRPLTFKGDTLFEFARMSDNVKLSKKKRENVWEKIQEIGKSMGFSIESDSEWVKKQRGPFLIKAQKDFRLRHFILTPPKSNGFKKPSIKEIEKYFQAKNIDIDAEHYFHSYESVGWILSGGKHMSDWKEGIPGWVKRIA